jgi:predicted dehydrogenase
MNKIRFAIVGCGRIAPRHAESLQRLEEATLVAAVDSDPAKVDAFAAKHGIRAFHSIADLLNWGEFDVANVCTPSGMHAVHSIQILNARKHVVVEKPMALRLEDADAMIRASKEADCKLFVVKQNRFNLPVIALRKALEAGRFGKLTMGTIRVRWSRDQSYYNQASWRGTWALDGGVFSNQASHHIDLLEWCMGEVETVFAKTTRHLVNIECEDTGIAVLKFKNGALGIIEATTATRPKDLEGSLSLMGEKGSVEISGFAVNKIRHFNFVSPSDEDAEIMTRFSENPPNVYGYGHVAYLQNVIDALKSRAKPLVDGMEGRKSLELIHALYLSAETGKEIHVPTNHQQSRLGKGL